MTYAQYKQRQQQVLDQCNEMLKAANIKYNPTAICCKEVCNYAIAYPFGEYALERGYRTLKELQAGVQEFIKEHKH